MSVERVEQIGEKADEQKPLVIYYNNRDQPLEELLSFPIHPFLRAARIQISRYVEIDIALGKVVIRHWLVKAHVILPDDTADMVVG